MLHKNGYLPLGHDSDHDDHDDHDDQSGQPRQDPRQGQSQEQGDQEPIGGRGRGHAVMLSAEHGPSSDGDTLITMDHPHPEDINNISATNSTTHDNSATTSAMTPADRTAADVRGSAASTSQSLRPSVHPNATAPAAPNATAISLSTTPAQSSSSSSLPAAGTASTNTTSAFQFPRLLGLKDRFAPSASSSSGNNASSAGSNNEINNSNINDNNRNSIGDSRSPLITDLAHIRPKQKPHITYSGPRGIEKSQKLEILREIRPDPHNLPEELLREQARSGAAVDAIANSGLYQELGSPRSPGGPRLMGESGGLSGTGAGYFAGGSPGGGGGGGGGNGGERGTLLGAGDGLGLGIGLGGKANLQSRWGRSGRRQRRVPSSGQGRENDQRVIQSSVFTPVLVSVDGGQ
ncbi:hypothetical protein BGZ98_002815, partial [Dissophora globulifera]